MTNTSTTGKPQQTVYQPPYCIIHKVQGLEGKVIEAIRWGEPIIITRPFDHTSRPLFPKHIHEDHLYLIYDDLPSGANAYAIGEGYQKSDWDPIAYAVQPYRLELEKQS